MTPRLLDLFCGAGGCAMGYHRAGFEVVGVDINPQPRYPFEFVQGGALDVLGEIVGGADWFPTHDSGLFDWPRLHDLHFDAIHASPPCQAFSLATLYHGRTEKHSDLIEPTRALLKQTGLPYVIENVAGAPLRKDVLLCGEMFGLRLHRHRYFETEGLLVMQPPHSRHGLKGAIHNCHVEDGHARLVAGNYADHESASEAMGIDWMNRDELAQAIPPAYTEHIGGYLMAEVQRRAKLTPTPEQAA